MDSNNSNNGNYGSGMSDGNSTPAQGADAARDAAGNLLARAQDKAAGMGRDLVAAVDGKRESAANALSSVAGQLHQGGDRMAQAAHAGADKVAGLAHGTADKLSTGAEFVRDHDMKAMLQSVETYVRKNPGTAMLVAGVIGFMAARAIRND
jgi:hypothetical protein